MRQRAESHLGSCNDGGAGGGGGCFALGSWFPGLSASPERGGKERAWRELGHEVFGPGR
jgi:hypothetical protein